jgi:hypothetical protein
MDSSNQQDQLLFGFLMLVPDSGAPIMGGLNSYQGRREDSKYAAMQVSLAGPQAWKSRHKQRVGWMFQARPGHVMHTQGAHGPYCTVVPASHETSSIALFQRMALFICWMHRCGDTGQALFGLVAEANEHGNKVVRHIEKERNTA